ncbi:peptidase inhibitor family I36 protein [Streptomyces caniferus]|uniref:peptidase inhibitor family I36 protein n=1 Tax=Streptomyces caniferus TaxID=285557 RepID=UPI0038291456
MMRKAILSAGAMSLSVMALIGFSPAAHADNGACPKNSFCLFEHDNYLGGRAVFHKTTRHLGNHKFDNGVTVGDNASSMINNMGVAVGLYQDGDCTGKHYNARRESTDPDFSNNGFDNKASCLVVS